MTAPRLKLAIVGDGKMGRNVRHIASNGHDFEVVAYLGEGDVGAAGPTVAQLAGADVAIEFTVPSAAAANVLACANAGVPVVSGTTGWDAARPAVEQAVRAGKGALLWSPNFAIGVQLFARAIERAARDFADAGFDAHLVETHHAEKKDAPSGTAKFLADRAKSGSGRDLPITSIRVGQVPGTHEVVFDALFEQVRFTHEARDRRVFAAGALAAARWLAGKQGVFTIDDMLGKK